MADMEHMKFLDKVALSDVSVIQQKEATYQGSWKAAGGRSAWFMMRRNMDRLMNMMRKPDDPPEGFNPQNLRDLAENIAKAGFDGIDAGGSKMVVRTHAHPQTYAKMLNYVCDAYLSENIFAKIREDSSGKDGTVLAVLRDLRRYLLLIEAEMMARGVVVAETAPSKHLTIQEFSVQCRDNNGRVISVGDEVLYKGKTVSVIKLLPDHKMVELKCSDESWHVRDYAASCKITRTRAEIERAERRVPRFDPVEVDTVKPRYTDDSPPICLGKPRTSEDGGQHEALFPWRVSTKNDMIRSERFSRFYRPITSEFAILEAFVDSRVLPRELVNCYEISAVDSSIWVLCMSRVPADLRDFYPRLQREMNAKEHEECRYPWMYGALNGKYSLLSKYVEAWGRDVG